MPITTQWADTTYVQQLDGNLNFTVTAPTFIDHVIPINAIESSASSSTAGYTYWNTNEGKLYHHNGTDWDIFEPQSRENDGVVYFNRSNSFFYKWTSGNSLEYIMWGASYLRIHGIYWYLKSISAQPSSYNLFDSYFNSSNHNIYYYNGASWVSLGSPVSSLDTTHQYGYMWYVIDEEVTNQDRTKTTYNPILWYRPSNYKFEYRYKQATLYVRDENNITNYYTYYITSLNGKTYANYAPMVFSTMGSDIRPVRFNLVINYTDNSGRTSGSDYIPETSSRAESVKSEYCRGRGGDSINTTFSQTATLPTYPTTEDSYVLDFRCTPTSSATASVLVPLSDWKSSKDAYLRYGLTWKVSKSGGTGGQFTGITVADAVTAGYMVAKGNNTTYNTFNSGRIEITFRESGQYTFEVGYRYRNTSQQYRYDSVQVVVNVYSKATPTLIVYSSSPSESGDFPPPYTVVLRDTSATTDAYQIPQQTITMDAGDNQDPESWTLDNSGSTVITMPDKTHVYNGYGPYKASLTIVDMNGNTAVGYAQFAPNKEPRIYTPSGETGPVKITCDGTEYQPSSTIVGGDAPILLAGTAFVAGSPLPTVTWNYTLQPSSEYYQGEKEGAFAELSLLSGGTYDVTCSITNGNTSLGTYAWTATAQSVTHIDTPVTLQDFIIWIYDSGGNRIDRIMPVSAQYTDRYAHESYCEFTVPISYPHIQNLLPGNLVAFGYLGKARLMIVSSLSEDAENHTVRITATDAASYALSSRVATTATNSTSGNGYDVQTCSAEALLRYFAVSNIRTGNRQITAMNVVGTCQDAGGRTTYSARYEDILTIFEDICTQSGLGWDSTLQSSSANTFSLKVISGMDRTYNDTTGGIIFEERKNGRGSAKVSDYTCIAGSNLAIAAGSGDGSSRQYSEYGATTASGLQRKEVFVDAGDSADALEMQRQAEQELKKQEEQTITIYPNENVYRLGVDYNVGDYVTVRTNAGIMLNLQIISANLSLDETGRQLSLECGTDLRDYQRLIRESKLANTYARK